jgi:Peptidase MA superfamily
VKGVARLFVLARLASIAVMLALASLAPSGVRAAEPVFAQPSAEAPLGGPTVFRTTLTADTQPTRVEGLISVPGAPAVTVLGATISGGNGSWSAEATLEGHILPNTPITYRFRAADDAGNLVVGPSAEVLVTDDRFTWQTLQGPIVQLHWYSGDQAFAQRALDIGEKAISNASTLLGVTETEPVDFFIYDDQAAFLDALGPGTRESAGGRAVANIRTMYGLIRPVQVSQDWVSILVTHELTHLVFNTATENVYHPAPFWLNEGIATYLSEGISARWQAALNLGIANQALIPLQGMAGTFGAGDTRFDLGYSESVSAVDFFVKTYTEPKLWELVRSYAEGVSDDDAFTRATGGDMAAFNKAWMESLGVSVPPELGPQPGPTGPLPPDWQGLPPATPGPVNTPGASQPGASQPTGQPTAQPSSGVSPRPTPTGPPSVPGSTGGDSSSVVLLGVLVLVVAAVLVVVWLVTRRDRQLPPPAPPPPPPAATGWPPVG